MDTRYGGAWSLHNCLAGNASGRVGSSRPISTPEVTTVMNVDTHQSSALYAVPDPVDDERFAAADSVDEAAEVFRSGWLAGGLNDRLAA